MTCPSAQRLQLRHFRLCRLQNVNGAQRYANRLVIWLQKCMGMGRSALRLPACALLQFVGPNV